MCRVWSRGRASWIIARVGATAIVALTVAAPSQVGASPRPQIQVSAAGDWKGCELRVRTRNAPRAATVVLQRHSRRGWRDFRRVRPSAGRRVRRVQCSSVAGAKVRAVLKLRGRLLAKSRTVRQPPAERLPGLTPPPPPFSPVPPRDAVAPDTWIASGPARRIATRTATFNYASDDTGPGTTFECALDDGPFSGCPTSGLDVAGLDHGHHVLQVRARDGLGNTDATPALYQFVVDLRPPDTTIEEGPPDASAQRAITTRYSGSPQADVSRYECRLDGAEFGDCPAGAIDLGGLADGKHVLEIRAIDALGNVDPTPAIAAWETDTNAPDTTIDAGPEATTARRTARFEFSSPHPDDVDHVECAVDGGAFRTCVGEKLSLRGLIDGKHTVAVRSVDAVGNADATPAAQTWTVDGPEDVDPAGTASGIADVFPTMLRDAIPADGVDPHVGAVTQGSGFPLAGGVSGSIGATLADGVTVADGGTTLGLTPVGSSTVTGVVKDNAVVYDDASGRDVAVRPTGDGGAEILSVLPDGTRSTSYEIDVPAGAKLVDLPTGDVAVVQPGVDPLPEIAEASTSMQQAEADVMAAAVESATDSQEEVEAYKAVEQSSDALVGTPALPEPPAPDASLLPDASGEIPAYADPTASNEQVAAAVEELARRVDPADITPEDAAAIKSAEADLEKAEALVTRLEHAETVAIEAAASTAFTDEMHAILADEAVQDIGDTADADLDIGDVASEQARTAMLAVDAQGEVTDGRVVGLLSAPMTKTQEGDPIVSSLDVTSPDTVSLAVPTAIEGDVVADPIIVPIAIAVGRLALQHAAKSAVKKAATKAATKVVSKGGSTASRTPSSVSNITRGIQRGSSALRSAARGARTSARRVVSQTRGAALSGARGAGARRQALAQEARRIAAERTKRLQADAKKVWDEAREAGRRAREVVLRKRDEFAEAARVIEHRSITDAVARVLKAGGDARRALGGIRDGLVQLLKRRRSEALKVIPPDAASRGAEVLFAAAIDEAIRRLDNPDDDPLVSGCLVPLIEWAADNRFGSKAATPAGKVIVVAGNLHSLAKCVIDAVFAPWTPVTAPGNTGPVPDPYPSPGEMRDIVEGALDDAGREGRAALADFSAPPAGAPERQAAIISTVVPPSIAAERTGYVQIAAVNQGKPLPLSSTTLFVEGGFPWVHAGQVPGRPDRIILTDENSDGTWSYGEVVNAVIEVRPPLMRSRSVGVGYGFISDEVQFSGGHGLTIHVDGPLEELRVSNQVTNGPLAMREDTNPVRLLTQPWTYCTRRGCNIYGTERWTGGVYHHAVCRTTGERTTNGEDYDARDDGNPGLYASNEYYGVQEGGTFGYVSWTWIHPDDRGGLGLPGC